MGLIRADFESYWTDSAPKDYTTNTLYFRDSTGIDGVIAEVLFGAGADWNATAAAWAEAMHDFYEVSTTGHIFFATGRGIKCSIYDMASPLPRPVLGAGLSTLPASSEVSASGNPVVACTVSFYGGRNLPRQRGRLFLGPMLASAAGSYRLSSGANVGLVTDFKALLAALTVVGGGPSVTPVVYSPKSNETHAITNIWMDDRHDVIRSRAPAPTGRATATYP
jgi:hypothetical protein